MIIALDGPAGVGKSTIAKKIADEASLFYVNSGNFYRAITFKVIENKILVDNILSIISIADKILFSISEGHLHINNIDIENSLHSDRIDSMVAQISSIPEVRKIVNSSIRNISKSMNIIVEGRDISTVVFPNADLKVYLDASVKTRAARRYKQGVSKLSLDEISSSIEERDKIDKSKQEGSLKISGDALYLDTSDLTIDAVCEKVLQKLSNM
ncbi:MAG: (d)CMP kinase [Spirochaetota bacterium]|nr:(d)CMP kinase [Spirochaetota bacterium]